MIRGMYGHPVHLKTKCKFFLNLLVVAQNLTKLLSKDKSDRYKVLYTVLYANYAYERNNIILLLTFYLETLPDVNKI